MLNVYTKKSYIPDGVEYIHYNEMYFDGFNPELPDNNIVRRILQEIDGAEYQTSKTFIGRFIPGAGLYNSLLSGGCKIALNVVLNPSKCFDTVGAGDNAINTILSLTDGHIVLQREFMIEGSGFCNVLVNGEKNITRKEELNKLLEDVSVWS